MGCWQWFSDGRIAENRRIFKEIEAQDPKQSLIFLHASCWERLRPELEIPPEEQAAGAKGGCGFVVPDGS